MEFSQETMKKLFRLVAFGVLLHWALQNLTFLRTLLGVSLGLLAPFILGGCIAFILGVPMVFVEKHLFPPKSKAPKGLRRPLSLLVTILLLLGVLFVAMFIILPELGRSAETLRSSIPAFTRQLTVWSKELSPYLPELSQWVNALELDWKGILSSAFSFLQNGAGNLLGSAVSIAASIFSGLVTFFLGFIFACYLLMQRESLKQQAKELLYAYLPLPRARRILELGRLTYSSFANFLSGQCLEAVILGTMFFVSMSLLRFPYALMISVLIAVLALIPMFGAFIGCAVGALMILMVDPIRALWFVVLFLVLQQVEGNLIYPRVVGSTMGLPSIWVLVAVTLGGSTMGVVGMLLFIPLTSVFYTLLTQAVDHRLSSRKLDRTKL